MITGFFRADGITAARRALEGLVARGVRVPIPAYLGLGEVIRHASGRGVLVRLEGDLLRPTELEYLALHAVGGSLDADEARLLEGIGFELGSRDTWYLELAR